MVDEMKLQHGVYKNVTTNTVVGFTPISNTFKWIGDDVRSLIDELQLSEV